MEAEGDRLPQAAQFPGSESVDARMVALMRSMLAVSALIIFVFDPFEPSRFIPRIYIALLCYGIYSVALCIAITAGRMPVPPRAQHWIDAAVCVLLVALSEGVTEMFFYFFFFAILVASFSRGFREGLTLTAISVGLFAVVSLVWPHGAAFDWDDFLTRPVYLLILGYMMAYWGGKELSMRRRLRLLRDVGAIANPRLGAEHALEQSLRRVHEFFDARACVLVCPRAAPGEFMMYRIATGARRTLVEPLSAESAAPLLGLPAGLSIAWPARRALADAGVTAQCQRVANLLEAERFATVPYEQREGLAGRIYLTTRERLSDADLEFLRHVADQIAAAVEKLALMEAITAQAAQLERTRISRDIHDTTVQPYIGLKLALEALQRRVPNDSPARKPLDELLEMATRVIADLRGYIARLRSPAPARERSGEELLSGLREHVERYRSFYGIDVELRSERTSQVSDRVAAEAYQIVCEGLANIHRHTAAKRAFVDLRINPDSLAIAIGNECARAVPPVAFVPRSIAERAKALGGTTKVELHERGHDVVHVAIPL
jgi:signal transduction histidine kinase